MLIFRAIAIEDRDLITACLAESPSQQLINCFEAFYLWRDIFGVEVAFCDGFAVFRIGERCFFPMGSGNLSAVLELLKGLKMIKLSRENLELMSGHFEATPVRDNFEYIYSTEKFRDYRGSALQPKRNFVNFATKNYLWRYEPLTAENAEECKTFAASFDGDASFVADNRALAEGLDNLSHLSLEGGVIRIDGSISALFVVAPLCDNLTAAGLFLRGDHSVKGVIPLLYREFFRANPRYKFVNLAEDLGLEGLRKNKLSYQPDFLLELFDVCG